jgi:hypothetical protein
MTKTIQVPRYFSQDEWMQRIQIRPKTILSSNSKLKVDGIYNLSFPAFRAAVVINGELAEFQTCPNAGACATYCYAQSGSYVFGNVRIKHTQNLQYLLDDPFAFADQLVTEILNKIKYNKKFRVVRINDSGDMNTALWAVMRNVMNRLPHVQFYAYTKQVSFMKSEKLKGNIPDNFTYVLSFGGLEDKLINKRTDRHSAIFPSVEALQAAKYSDAHKSDVPASDKSLKNIGLVVHGNHKAIGKIRAKTNLVLEKSVKLSA